MARNPAGLLATTGQVFRQGPYPQTVTAGCSGGTGLETSVTAGLCAAPGEVLRPCKRARAFPGGAPSGIESTALTFDGAKPTGSISRSTQDCWSCGWRWRSQECLAFSSGRCTSIPLFPLLAGHGRTVIFKAIFHLVGTFRTRSISPGLWTGIFLYPPLFLYGFWHFLGTGQASLPVAIGSAFAGGSYHFWMGMIHVARARRATELNTRQRGAST
jgi:hypothetical protein